MRAHDLEGIHDRWMRTLLNSEPRTHAPASRPSLTEAAGATAMLLLLLLCAPIVQAQHEEARAPSVLILEHSQSIGPPYNRIGAEVATALSRQWDGPLAISELDIAEAAAQGGLESIWAEVLERRFGAQLPDVVIAIGPPAISVWLENRDTLDPEAPLVAMARDDVFGPADLRDDDVGIWAEVSFRATAEDVLQLLPETKRMVFLFGGSPWELAMAAEAESELAALGDRLTAEFTTDKTLPEIRQMLANLPDDTVVYATAYDFDASGTMLRGESMLSLAHGASRVPVFGSFHYDVGGGAVGGRLIPLDALVERIANAALALLRGQTSVERWNVVRLSPPAFDWRELRRWGIPEDRLPAGSQVLFRPPTIWEQYAGWIVLALAIIVAQSVLLATLFLQRRQLLRAEIEQSRLSGKLITAHEDQRRRIARELHDDLSQRLALLAIHAETIRNDARSGDSAVRIAQLSEELASVGRDAHDLSYRLHPSILTDLGLATALRTECERVARRTDVQVRANIADVGDDVPQDVAMCAYRIAQEAMNNTIRHADATAIEVELQRDNHGLLLEVNDNGKGFDVDHSAARHGLGLTSMRERVRLVNGHLHIRSAPRVGTRVRASIPLAGGPV